MRTKQELFRAAKDRLAEQHQRALSRALYNRQQAQEKLPELAGLEDEARRCGFEAARLAATGAEKDKVQAMLAKGDEIRARRDELLRGAGIDPAGLEPVYQCPACRDTGRVNGNTCECLIRMARRLRREEIAASTALSVSRFDALDRTLYPDVFDPALGDTQRHYMTELLDQLEEYANTFDERSVSLVLRGNAGLGKTHAALAIAGMVLEKGYDVVYISAQELFGRLEKTRFDEDNSLMEGVLEADLLILDDLGTEYVSPYMLSCFYTILNTRIGNRRPTIYTTNIVDGTAFEARYTEKIASRLGGECEDFLFVGEDIRQLRA